MARYWRVEFLVEPDEVTIVVSRNGKFYDEASFHPSETEDWEFYRYIGDMIRTILGKKHTGDEE